MRFLFAALAYVAFVALLFAGSRFLPGRSVSGAVRPDGTRATYKLNGLLLFAITLAAAAMCLGFRLPALVWVQLHFFSLLAAANVFAFAFLFALWLRRPAGPATALDFFRGTEPDPKWMGIDLKVFSYRPSLIGLAVINLSFAAVQIQRYGHLSARMALCQAFYLVYLVNYFQFEDGMLFTWDVIAERFGWMLVWGDYVLVPFFYSLPAWVLVDRVDSLSITELAALTILYGVGLWLFRGANQQKHDYKSDPTARIWGRPPETIGGKLLVSGFWGVGRKLNYTGEICMYWAWTLTCGFASFAPYVLPVWLTLFLAHRAWRDDRRCRAKYGPLWDAYCRRARFRMLPFLY